jgi:hypothetical protein
MSKGTDTGVSAFGVSGMILAALISWSMWHHVGWAFLATVFGWGYVIYHYIAH